MFILSHRNNLIFSFNNRNLSSYNYISFYTELLQILENAQKKGFVSVKWTSFALFGASGVGKTSLLNLLLRKEPVTEHNSTPVAKAPEVRLVSKEERDDVIMSDESCFWTSTDPETMKIKFLQAIKYHVRTQKSTSREEIESVEQTPLTSQVTPKKKPHDSLPTDHSQNKEQLQSISEVKESKEKPLLTSQVTPKKKPHDSLPTDHSQNKEQLQSISEVKESKEKPLLTSLAMPKKKPPDSLPTDHSQPKEQLQLMSEVKESKEKRLPTSQATPKKKPPDSLPTDHSQDKEQLQSMSKVKGSKWKSLFSSLRSTKKKPLDSLRTDHSRDKDQLQFMSGVQESKKPYESRPTDYSPDKEQLQSISGVQVSKEKPLLTSQVMPKKKPHDSLSTDPSTLNEELLQFLTEVKKSDELYNTHMIYGVDLGGQAAFLDIAPALLRYHSLNMVLFRLDEKLDDAANFFYSVHGRKVGESEKRQMSTMQLTKSFFRCKSQLRPPFFEGVQKHGRPHFIVIGTCYDEYERLQENIELKESLDEKNERLRSELKNYEDVRHDFTKGKDIIFPVNNMGRGRSEEEMAQRIRRITGRSYIIAEVPARWFFFQVELKSKTKGQRMISLDECLEIGKSVGMERKEVLAALWYFHNLSIYLHFPGILSHVVFLDPQVLFDMLSQIIAVSYGDDRYDDATIKSLKTKGIFKRELLDTMEFEEDVFSCDDFLKLMEGLLIISKIPNDTRYFIPCVLDIIDDPFEDISDAIEPLYLTWDDELIPNGLFTSLVVFLMGHVSPTQFKLVNDVYRNNVVLRCQNFGGALHLLDQVKSLTIRYFGPSRNCFNIRRMIHQGIESIVHTFGWTDSLASTQEGFRCKIEGCTNSSFHLCHLISEHEEMLCCDVSNVKCSADKTRHLSWFHEGMMLYYLFCVVSTSHP